MATFALAVALVGCSTTPTKSAAKTGPETPARPVVTEEDFLRLAGGGVPDILKNTIEIRHYSVEITRDEELPELRLELFNRLEDEPLHLELRTLWFRQDGSLIDASTWAHALIPPRRAYRYRCLAYSPYAVREQVQLRRLYVGDASEEFPPLEDAAP